ncbi:MAG TPA: hypothetical protein VEG30_06250 [Terriglobales bacterium]|nr:hypothetical protein [Terriglobales bacterium]
MKHTPRRVAIALLLVAMCLVAFRVTRPEPAHAQVGSSGVNSTISAQDWPAWQTLLEILSGQTPSRIPTSMSFANPSGTITSYQPNGATTTKNNGFFASLGTNGRTCFTCHQPQDGWALTPASVRATYALAGPNATLFSRIDAANCPTSPGANSSNGAAFAYAHSQLLTRANFRINVDLPAKANQQWSKVLVNYDPTGCENDPKYGLPAGKASVYRRVLPAANLAFLDPMGPLGLAPASTPGRIRPTFAPCNNGGFCLGKSPAQNNTNIVPTGSPTMGGFAIMWDSREPNLITQFIGANGFHAQATQRQLNQLEGTLANPMPAACAGVNFNSSFPLPTACLMALNNPENCPPTNPLNAGSPVCQAVQFQTNVFFAQAWDILGQDLTGVDGSGATGGAQNLAGFLAADASLFEQRLSPPTPNLVLTPGSEFTLFDNWAGINGNDFVSQSRASIYRGQQIFNTRTFVIAGVSGFSDIPGAGRGTPATGGKLTGRCTNCHNVVNVGDDAGMPGFHTGIGDNFCQHATFLTATAQNPVPAPCGTALPPGPGEPLFTFYCPKGSIEYFSNPDPTNTYDVFQTTDPGFALITGQCNDLGRMKRPILRGLASRAPYFHNGSAATLQDLVNFYNQRFNIGLSDQDMNDLVNFLSSL